MAQADVKMLWIHSRISYDRIRPREVELPQSFGSLPWRQRGQPQRLFRDPLHDPRLRWQWRPISRHPSIKALPVSNAGGSQQPLRLNRNAERRQRPRARRQQTEWLQQHMWPALMSPTRSAGPMKMKANLAKPLLSRFLNSMLLGVPNNP